MKLGIVGCGYLGNIIADAYVNGYLEGYELVGVMSKSQESAEQTAKKTGAKACKNINELLALEPDYIAEAASGQVVREIAKQVLTSGSNFVVLSIGAFADSKFYEDVKKTAYDCGKRVHIVSGAIGGFDVLRTISLMGEVRSGIETRKGPQSLQGTPIFKEGLMTDTKETEVFAGSAKEAIALFPTKVNVAVATALATAGADKTKVNIHSIPGFVGDDHKITAEIEGVRAIVDVYSNTSEIAGWSVVAALRNIVSPIVF